jgi:hypothetical protein
MAYNMMDDQLKESGIHGNDPAAVGMNPTAQTLMVLVSIFIFFVINEVVRFAARRYARLSVFQEMRSRNLAVSWIHADFCAVFVTYW